MTFREWHQQKTSEGYVINFDDAEWGWDARDAEVEAMKEELRVAQYWGPRWEEENRKVEALRRAVEHAVYMARFADLFLAADNELQKAISVHECTGDEETETAVDMASESKSEAWRSLTSSIYEFRKRAAKALGE